MKIAGTKAGFTLIELLVVIAIISLLSSIIIASLSVSRAKSRDAARIEALLQVRDALELYRTANGSYPSTYNPGQNYNYTGTDAGTYQCCGTTLIPGITPYLSSLPNNPGTSDYEYYYVSDGTHYIYEEYNVMENNLPSSYSFSGNQPYFAESRSLILFPSDPSSLTFAQNYYY